MTRNNKKILLSGARSPITLDLARQLKKCGHTIYVADSSPIHVCRFSNCVEKSFCTPSPRFHEKDFISSMASIINENAIDLYIPTNEEIFTVSQNLSKLQCKVLCEPFKKLKTLHNKWLFNVKLRTHDVAAPVTQLVRCQADLNTLSLKTPYILKPVYSRATQAIHIVRSAEKKPLLFYSENNPWIAQEFIEGKKYCSYTICHNGEIAAHATYPVTFSIDNSSCLTFESFDHPEIFKWVEKFVRDEHFTGQIAFDFIERDGTLYPIECNPRATSGVHLFDHTDRIDYALFKTSNAMTLPKEGARQQIAIGMAMYGWRNRRPGFFKTLFNTTDVIFSWKDLGPFLAQPLLFLHYLRNAIRHRGTMAAVFNHDLEWNDE